MATALAAEQGANIQDALAKIRASLGLQSVITEHSQLSAYVDRGSLLGPDAPVPAAAVLPENVGQIRSVVAIAREFRIRLWPLVGAGKFVGSGARTIVIDHKRMNRILEVNEEFAYALIEPGVTYAQLHERLKDSKPRLWLDCASSPAASLVSETVTRKFGYTPYGDHAMMQCGMEVVLPDGAVVRTGMGAMPKSSSWQLFKYGYGPFTDGSFTQSSLGIVTRMGIWLMPAPPVVKPFMITVPHAADLHQVIEILKPLKVTMAIPNTVVIAHILNDAALAAPRSRYFSGSGPMTAEVQAKIAADMKRGIWNIYGALYGLPPAVDATWKYIQASFRPIDGIRFYSGEDRKGDKVWEYRSRLMCGEPADPLAHLRNWNGGGHADLAQAAPITGGDAVKMFQIARKTAQAHGFDYLGSFSGLWRSVLASNTIAFNPASAEQRSRARDCAIALIREMAASGYGSISASPELHESVVATYSANNGALWRVHGRLKNEFDPSGVIAPEIPTPQRD